MKLKLFLLVFIAVILLSAVSASENITYSNESKNITFEDMNFTIPAGFGQTKNTEPFEDLGSHGKTCFYMDENHDEIVISVVYDWMGMHLDELHKDGAVKSTVKGHEGWNYTEGDLHYFSYVVDDKGIIVAVTNETMLDDVIVK